MNEQMDVLDKLKWFNNPDNHKGTDTVAWIPRRILAEAIAEIRNLRERDEERARNDDYQEPMTINGIRGQKILASRMEQSLEEIYKTIGE